MPEEGITIDELKLFRNFFEMNFPVGHIPVTI